MTTAKPIIRIAATAMIAAAAFGLSSCASPAVDSARPATGSQGTSTAHNGEAPEIIADYPSYGSVDKAVGASTIVVRGTVLNSYEATLHPDVDVTAGTPETNPQYGMDEDDIDVDAMGVPRTITRFKVTHVLKGAVKPGDIIKVSQVGGTDTSGAKVRESGTVLLGEATASEFLLLLVDNGNGTYSAINPQEGLFAVNEEGALTALSADSASVSPAADLSVYEQAAR